MASIKRRLRLTLQGARSLLLMAKQPLHTCIEDLRQRLVGALADRAAGLACARLHPSGVTGNLHCSAPVSGCRDRWRPLLIPSTDPDNGQALTKF